MDGWKIELGCSFCTSQVSWILIAEDFTPFGQCIANQRIATKHHWPISFQQWQCRRGIATLAIRTYACSKQRLISFFCSRFPLQKTAKSFCIFTQVLMLWLFWPASWSHLPCPAISWWLVGALSNQWWLELERTLIVGIDGSEKNGT